MTPRAVLPRLAALLCSLAIAGSFAGTGCARRTPAAPTTADERGPIRFTDITPTSGLNWKHVNGAAGRLYYPELVGGGGGLVDVDGDGWLDVVLVNSGRLPGFAGDPGRHGLFLNRGDGTFRDASRDSGLAGPGYGMGVAAADYDSDGRVDLYITGIHDGRLYRNLGGGRFADVTTPPLRNRGHWGTSATWTDVNGDGQPDLFIGNYVRWSPATEVPCFIRGIRTYCGPTSYPPDRCTLLLNRGAGRFEDVSGPAGIASAPGKALGTVACDFDGDRRPDLAVACDLVPNLLLRNRDGGTFEEVAVERGIALSERGVPRAGMGIDAQEEEPGRWTIWIGNLTREGTACFRQTPEGWFADEAGRLGLLEPTLRVLTFGLVARDLDGDGLRDLVLANGHIDLLADRTRDEPVLQPPTLLRRTARGYLDLTRQAGEPFLRRYLGRALACGDIDNDGDPDLLLVENGGRAHLWRNDTPARSWLGIDCRTPAGGPAIGARVEVSSAGRVQIGWVRGDGSYLSANDFRLSFGLDRQTRADSVRVLWPDGRAETHRNLAVGRYWRLRPGQPPE